MRARLKTTSALSGIFVGSWALAPGDHGKILEMFERQPSSSIPPDPPGCERRSIRICDRQSPLRIYWLNRFDSIRIHEQSDMYQQSFLSTITLDGSGSGYLVTGIYWKLQRRYHRDQITTTRNMSRPHSTKSQLGKPMINNAIQRRIYARQRAIAKGK